MSEEPEALVSDKSKWGSGPWQDEPDRLEFEHLGFPCLLHRSETTGTWCGYVAVPLGHPWYGHDHNEIDVDVHGGLTYSGASSGDICHVPKAGQPDDVYWLGFDAGHAWDWIPGISARLGELAPYGTYRDLEYMRAEVQRLAEQAAGAQR